MVVPRPHRRLLLLSSALLFLSGLVLCLSQAAPGARAGSPSAPSLTLPPALGNYADASVQLGANTTVTPDSAPFDTVGINVSTSTSFKGRLEGDPATGVVRVTNAHPAGTFTVTVKAFSGDEADTKTFLLTVTTPAMCNPLTFATASLGVGAGPLSTAVGDFNRDGRQDIAVANNGANSVSVLLGDGAGGFGAATNFGVGSQPRSVTV